MPTELLSGAQLLGTLREIDEDVTEDSTGDRNAAAGQCSDEIGLPSFTVDLIAQKVYERVIGAIGSLTRNVAEMKKVTSSVSMEMETSNRSWKTCFEKLSLEVKQLSVKSSKCYVDLGAKGDSIRDTMEARFDAQQRKMTTCLDKWQNEIRTDLQVSEARIEKVSEKGKEWVEQAVSTISEELKLTSLEVGQVQQDILQQTSVINEHVCMIAEQKRTVDVQSMEIQEMHAEIREMRDAEWSRMVKDVEVLRTR